MLRMTLAAMLVAGVVVMATPAAFAVEEKTEAAAVEKTIEELAPPKTVQAAPLQVAPPEAPAAAPPNPDYTTETIIASAGQPPGCVWHMPPLRDESSEIHMAVAIIGGTTPELAIMLAGAMARNGAVQMVAFENAQLVNSRLFDSAAATPQTQAGPSFRIVIPVGNLEPLIAAIGTPGASLRYTLTDKSAHSFELQAAAAQDVTAFRTCAANLTASPAPAAAAVQ